jgi:thiamine pyrophosphate-dependent acetolactate synthase large subunit-like protein
MDVAETVGRSLAAHGVDHVFGVVGSGNFHVTNALIAGGARFVAAAHEGGAASMADAFARVSGRLSALSVHQGPGVTNALTGIAEAAKSHTPMLVLAPEATQPASNFFVDLDGIAAAVGAVVHRVRPERAAEDAATACREARAGAGRTVVLALPLNVQAAPAPEPAQPRPIVTSPARPLDIGDLMLALAGARRPVFIAGRGASRRPDASRGSLSGLADRCGALLAVSAAAKGLFAGDPWQLDVSGGFATPLAAELIPQADLVVAWGSTLNMWTTRHGKLIGADATVAQVDLDPAALGRHRFIDIGVEGDLVAVADACAEEWDRRGIVHSGWRTPDLAARIAAEGRWRDVPYVDGSDAERIDPRTLTIALDDLLPAERTVVLDSGNFMGYPSMFLGVPDASGFCFTQAFQSIGLGLSSAIGAAVARPDRLTVAALGDGGFLMSVAELTTAVRLGLPLVVVVYNDAAYGAEVHHFGPDGHALDTVRFPDTDLAGIARGFGCAAATVRTRADLAAVAEWLNGPRPSPVVVDAKVASAHASWWLEEAFRGH